MNMDQIQVEMDALFVWDWLQNSSMISSFDLILNDIREIAKDFTSVCFMFAKRSANIAAHLLAREVILKFDCLEWLAIPPNLILSTLYLGLS